jgi:hypothetical protein
MSYINIIGSGVTQTSYTSYAAYTLNNTTVPVNNPLVLYWSTQFIDTPYIVAGWIDITATDAGSNTVMMPNAQEASTGEKVTFNNPGTNAYIVANNGGTTLATIAPGEFWEFILTDNTTVNGSWRVVRPAGSAAVTSINADSLNNNVVITGTPGLPITTTGTINVGLAHDLLALTQFGGATGFADRTGVDTWALKSITGATPITVTTSSANIQIGITPNQYVDSIGADVPNGTNAANLVITSSTTNPITGNGIFHFAFGSDLLALISFGAGTGIPVRTAPGVWSLTGSGIANVRFNGVTGAIPQLCTINSQFNVATVNHIATGQWVITYTTPLANTNYVVIATAGNGASIVTSYAATLTTSVTVYAFTTNTNAPTDVADISVTIS